MSSLSERLAMGRRLTNLIYELSRGRNADFYPEWSELMAMKDQAVRHVVGRYADGHFVTDDDFDFELPHFTAELRGDRDAVLEHDVVDSTAREAGDFTFD